MKTLSRALVVVVALSLASGGCGGDGPGSSASGNINLSAAKSLEAAFDEIIDDFTAADPEVEVTADYDSSSALATRIAEGAPADVFASADRANMEKLTEDDLVSGEPQVFARNELVIVTKPGNPEGIAGLEDLADAGTVSLCGKDVPCGRYAEQALENANVAIPEADVTRGQDVGATLTAVSEGDAVAGVVYATDALEAGDAVTVVPIPSDDNVTATYPIGVLARSGHRAAAEAFVEFVLGDKGQAVLREFGFLPPD